MPPGPCNLSGTAAVAGCSHRARNCSADTPFSAGQTEASGAGPPARAEPKTLTAAGLALSTMPASSSNKTGQAASDSPRTTSEFMCKNSLQTPNLRNYDVFSNSNLENFADLIYSGVALPSL